MKVPEDPRVLAVVAILAAGFIWLISSYHCKAIEEKLDQIDQQTELSRMNLPTTVCTLIPLPENEQPAFERLYKPLTVDS